MSNLQLAQYITHVEGGLYSFKLKFKTRLFWHPSPYFAEAKCPKWKIGNANFGFSSNVSRPTISQHLDTFLAKIT